MKTKDTFMKFGVDFLSAILLASIVAALTPFVVGTNSEYNYIFVYVWVASLLVILLLSCKIYQSHKNRFFTKRFKNEEEAIPTIAELSRNSKSKLCVLSKVGSSIFFNFDDYAAVLEKGRPVQVLVADPEDRQLIDLMNRIYVKQTNVSKSWLKMVGQLRSKLEEINENHDLPEKEYIAIQKMLEQNKDGSGGYKLLIYACFQMWLLAQHVANQNLKKTGSTFETHGLDIRSYDMLPDIKAWIFDEGCCLLGNYDALHLGRDNPIDLYQPRKDNDVERWQFQNVLQIWDFKFEKANSIELPTIVEY